MRKSRDELEAELAYSNCLLKEVVNKSRHRLISITNKELHEVLTRAEGYLKTREGVKYESRQEDEATKNL